MKPPKQSYRFADIALGWKISIVVLAIISLMGASFFFVIQSTMTQTLYTEHNEKGIAIATNLATNVVNPLLIDNLPHLQLLLTNSQENDVVYAFLLDEKNSVLVHTFPGGFPVDLKKIIAPLSNEQKILQEIDTEDGRILDIAVPVMQGEGGVVHIGLSSETIEERLSKMKQHIIVTYFLISVVAIIVALFFSKLLTGPLEKLATAAENIGQGNLGHRVFVDRGDEIGILAKIFNEMAEGLQEDITKRLQAEQDLASEKERLAVTLRSIGDGVITTDTESRIVLINKVAEELTGWKQDESVGRPLGKVLEIINEKNRESVDNPVKNILKSGDSIGMEDHTLLIARDGTERSVADSGAPIRDKDGRIIGAVLVFRDVTEEKLMAEELHKSRKLESVGLLAGGIAHDFNNILAAILGNIELSIEYTDSEDKRYTLLTQAKKATLRATGLTQQLLTFAKGGEPVKEIASIAEVIRDSSDFVLRGSSVQCQYRIADNLWPVEIDKGQISQVMQNIILNASSAMPDGGLIDVSCKNVNNIEKRVSFLKTDDFIKIEIKDSGIGIPPELLDQIFDPYFTTKDEGSGLGLSITHSIVIKHGGHISAVSEQPGGTRFTIYLPASTSPRINTIDEIDTRKIHGKGTIMVMDDEEMVRDIAGNMLTHLGYKIELVNNGNEAIKRYKELAVTDNPIDLIIMDLTIPGGMGGEEVALQILTLNPKEKIIVSSGYSNDPIMADYKKYGFSSSIAKPFDLVELSKAVSSILAC
jgi:PAS domain S-box-containing protein